MVTMVCRSVKPLKCGDLGHLQLSDSKQPYGDTADCCFCCIVLTLDISSPMCRHIVIYNRESLMVSTFLVYIGGVHRTWPQWPALCGVFLHFACMLNTKVSGFVKCLFRLQRAIVSNVPLYLPHLRDTYSPETHFNCCFVFVTLTVESLSFCLCIWR